MLGQAITLINGKGGVGKTSIASNIAGLAAAGGYRVLAVDMDPQGNMGRDLGYRQDGRGDGGRSLLDAVQRREPVKPLRDVRPGLDVVPGGTDLEELADYLAARRHRSGTSIHRALEEALAPMAGEYHVIIVDTPPGERLLQTLALTATHYAVIPTKSDDGSVDGLERVSALFSTVREGDEHARALNPDLDLLGVVVFGVGTASRAIRRQARAQVATELGDEELVFNAVIRHVEGPARDCRRRGVLAHELEAASARGLAEDDDPHTTASGLASDYEALTTELLARYADLQNRYAAGAVQPA